MTETIFTADLKILCESIISTNNTLTSIRSNGPNLAKNLVLLSDDSSTLIDGTESDFTEKMTSENDS